MSASNRYSGTFSRTESDNRWYKWLAGSSLLLAMGLLTVYILQKTGFIPESPF